MPPTIGERGQRYRVAYGGSTLVESSRVPEFDACRALLARGITGTLEVWRPGKACHDMQLDIVGAAKLTVIETENEGPRFAQWRPFSHATPNAVLSRAGGPLAGADKIPVLEPV